MYGNNVIGIFLLIISFKNCFSANHTVQVNIKQGLLSGIETKTFLNKQTYYSFKGIPFAVPPINELRFRPPKKHQGWEGLYKVDDREVHCIQYNLKNRYGENFGISGIEDCLYLNVFTPSINRSLPVIVFDNNDHLTTRYDHAEAYSADFFIEEDCVVVTINHRLGIFGYLTTEDEVIPANAGLKDFILGLQWIQNNIAKFGGDANKVTIIGSGGGAAIGNILLYTEKAKGLFHRVIMQSGTAYEPTYFNRNSKKNAFRLGEEFGIQTNNSETLLLELQKLDAEKLITNGSNVIERDMIKTFQINAIPFGPAVEQVSSNAVITNLPENSEIVNDVPALIGFNSREGLDMVSFLLEAPNLLENTKLEVNFSFPIRPNFRFDHNSIKFKEASKKIRQFYLKGDYLKYYNILNYAEFMQDVSLNYAVNEMVKTISRKLKSSVYYYMFDYRGSLNENSNYISRHTRINTKNWGATVEDELCYLVLCSRIKHAYTELQKRISQQPETKMIQKMVRMWTNFVKDGNPTPTGDPVLKTISWHPVNSNSEDINYLHITKSPKTKVNPFDDKVKFWTDLLSKYSQMAIDGVIRDELHKDEL